MAVVTRPVVVDLLAVVGVRLPAHLPAVMVLPAVARLPAAMVLPAVRLLVDLPGVVGVRLVRLPVPVDLPATVLPVARLLVARPAMDLPVDLPAEACLLVTCRRACRLVVRLRAVAATDLPAERQVVGTALRVRNLHRVAALVADLPATDRPAERLLVERRPVGAAHRRADSFRLSMEHRIRPVAARSAAHPARGHRPKPSASAGTR